MEDKKQDSLFDEEIVTAWVRLTSVLKNTRLTRGLNYNEAVIMNLAYHQYRKDGEGLVSFKYIVETTKMLKSLVNRTIDSLVAKRLLERCDGEDKRTTFVKPVKDNLCAFLQVHEQSLTIAHALVDLVGEEDARAFVRISERIVEADLF